MDQHSGQSLVDRIATLVDFTNRIPALGWMLTAWDRSFTLSVDGARIGIVTRGGQASVISDPTTRPDVWFGLSERTLDRLMSGRLSPLTAKLTGQLQSEGNLADTLRFAAIFTACLQQRRMHSLQS